MKYNRALDYTALALNELRKGNAVLSAKLLAKAGTMSDLPKAISILEASNKAAFAANRPVAAKRLKANDDLPFDDLDGDEDLEADFDSDPLDEIEGDEDLEAEFDDFEEEGEPEEAPGVAMAKVLQAMTRKARR